MTTITPKRTVTGFTTGTSTTNEIVVFKDGTYRVGGSGPQISSTGVISTAGVVNAGGSNTAPSYTFSGDLDTGLYSSAGDVVHLTAGGKTGLGVYVAGAGANVVLAGGTPADFGSTTPGEGCVFINNRTTAPVGVPNGGSGGILYVDGAGLNYLNNAGTLKTLTDSAGGDVVGPSIITDIINEIAVFDGTTGKLLRKGTGAGDSIKLAGSLTVAGNFTVSGTTTTINTSVILVEDKHIELGVVADADDDTADGGGIILKGDGDKSILWSKAGPTNTWTMSGNVKVTTALTVGADLLFSGSTVGAIRTTLGTAGTGLVVEAGAAVSSGTDDAGGDLDLRAGVSTGTGGAAIHLSVPYSGLTSASADNALYNKMTLPSRYVLSATGTTGADNDILEVALTLGQSMSMWISISIHVTGAGNTTSSESQFLQLATSHTGVSGTYTAEIVTGGAARSRTDDADLSAAYTLVTGTNKVTLRVNLRSDFTTPTAVGDVVVISHTNAAITYLL